MKKGLTLILALALAFALGVPALAAGENPIGGSTTVTYTVDDKYSITIPAEVAITGGTGTQEVSVVANSVIPANMSLQFMISDATNKTEGTNFRMKNSLDAAVFLTYTITYPTDQTISDFNTAFLTATPAECYAGKSVTLTYTTGTAQSAGTYSDTLTFTVGLANGS